MTQRPILLATDGSPAARGATNEAVRLARATTSPLHAVFVIHPPSVREDAEFVLESVRLQAESAHVVPVLHLRSGDPADEILATADVHDAGMIVLGQHGWSRKGAPGGGVANAVRHRSPVPVLLVPEERSSET